MAKRVEKIMERADRCLSEMHSFKPANDVQASRKAARIESFNRMTSKALASGDWSEVIALMDELEIA